MEAFTELRRKAKENRDKALAQVYDEYRAAMANIAELEQRLVIRKRPRLKPAAACISAAMPTDRSFTIEELWEALEIADPTRTWNRETLVNYLGRLRKKGLVRTVQRAQGADRPAIYARAGIKTAPVPFEKLALTDATYEVLKASSTPLNTSEITARLHERGYSKHIRYRVLRGNVSAACRRRPELFKRAPGGKWSAI